MAETIKIGGELESTATGNKVADVANIKDKTQGDKSQAQINAEINTALADRYTKTETYSKTELDSMITTPDIDYKNYDTYAAMLAETDHPAGAIYRVANYDGTQAVTNKYAEYSWDGTQYKLMAVRDHGIDNEPTAGSDNLVKSGGVKENLIIGGSGIIDLSLYENQNAYIGPGSYWNANLGQSKFVKVIPSNFYKITANNTNYTHIAFLTTNQYVIGEQVSFATGASRVSIDVSQNILLQAPNNAEYLYVLVESSQLDRTPIVEDLGIDIKEFAKTVAPKDKQEMLQDFLIGTPNLFDILFTDNKAIVQNTGEVRTPAGWSATLDYIPIPNGANKIAFFNMIISNASTDIGTAFYDNNKDVISGKSISPITNASNYSIEYRIVDVPENAKYVRFTYYNTSAISSLHLPNFQVYFYASNQEPECAKVNRIDSYLNNQLIQESKEIGLHTVPQSIGQLNAVKRIRQITDIEWTPAFDIPRLGYTTSHVWYEDVFKAGVTYKGIPYGRAIRGSSDYGYGADTFKPGINIGFDTFITSIMNRDTAVEVLYPRADVANHESCLYSTVCAGAVSYALQKNYIRVVQWMSQQDIVNLGYVNYNSQVFDVTGLYHGDILNDNLTHVSLITDIVKDENGNVVYIEVSESTPEDGENENVYGTSDAGSIVGGTARRMWWTLEDFRNYWGKYYVLRCTNIDKVEYTPSPYVQIGNEVKIHSPHLLACIPFMGDGFRYVKNSIPNTKIIIETSGYDKLRVKKDGVNWNANSTTEPYDVVSELGYVDVAFSEIGEYEAYMFKSSVGEEIKTSVCKWSVISEETPIYVPI